MRPKETDGLAVIPPWPVVVPRTPGVSDPVPLQRISQGEHRPLCFPVLASFLKSLESRLKKDKNGRPREARGTSYRPLEPRE